MSSLKYRIFVTSALVAALSVAIHAASTRPISYQGRLTNSLGVPVANSTYNVTFAIYADSSSGSALWTEEHKVATSDGLFTAFLGSIVSFDPSLFSEFPRYLGITIEAGPEMSPRILIASVPYALNSSSGGTGYWSQSGSSIYYNSGNVGIGTSTPTSALEVDGDMTVAKSDGPRLILKDNVVGAERPRISFGGDYLAIFDGDPSMGHIFSFMNTFSPGRDYDASLRIHGRTTNSWDTYLSLTHNGTDATISTDVGGITLAPANGSIVLPDNAIDSWETLDEPGIAASESTKTVTLSPYGFTDLITLAVTIPAAGYIVVDGRCLVKLTTPTDAPIGAQVYVEEIGQPTGNPRPHAAWVYFSGGVPSPGVLSVLDESMSLYRIFYRAAGTYSFKMVGMQTGNSGTGFSARVQDCMLKATFYPTSYGSVATLVSAASAGQFDRVEAVSVPTGVHDDGSATTMYRVDLRELELKAARARAEAEKLERQVAEAKMKEMREQHNQTAPDKK